MMRWWYGAFAALQAADVATTWYVLDRDIGREGNPLMVGVAEHVWMMVLAKSLMLALALFVYFRWRKHATGFAVVFGWMVAVFATVMYVAVVVNNLKICLT